MDSQAPNAAAKEWLLSGGFGEIEALRAETVHGDSRFDFSFFRDGKLWFLEVKGVTLEENGVCAFPDAPTLRGAKHLRGLTRAAAEGYGAGVLFVIQMADVKYLHPNDATDPGFCRRPAGSRRKRRPHPRHGLRRNGAVHDHPPPGRSAAIKSKSVSSVSYCQPEIIYG